MEDRDSNRIWVQRLMEFGPTSYLSTSILIGCIIYLIFIFFSTRIRFSAIFYPFDFAHFLQTIAISLLISFQLAGIQYLINDSKRVFRQLDQLYLESRNICSKLESRFINYRGHSATIAAVLIIFLVAKQIRFFEDNFTFFYLIEPNNPWSAWLDVYNLLIESIALILLATSLWIIFSISMTLNQLESGPERSTMKIGAFNIGMKLEPLRNLNSKIIAFYFVSISLAIASYITPFSIASYESFLLIILLFVGVAFFLIGLAAIRRVLNSRIESELDEIDNAYKYHMSNLLEKPSISKREEEKSEPSMNFDILNALQKEREQRIALQKGWIDPVSIGTFIGSFIIPLITLIQKLV